MSNRIFHALYVLGMAFLIWMASSFAGSDGLAVTMILMIAVVFSMGVYELKQFRTVTGSLEQAIATSSNYKGRLIEWLQTMHHSLQQPIKQRVEGSISPLPSPVFTPYLVGLLVMLGLIGTFAGMVGTLKGAVIALEGTTELEAIRAGLAAPMKGLGLAFGTSVAGVGASAILGLMSTLSRRERIQSSRELNQAIDTNFCEYSLSYNRLESYKASQAQVTMMPELIESVSNLCGRLESMGENISETLLSNQQTFQQDASDSYRSLSDSVNHCMTENLHNTSQLIAETIAPYLKDTVASIREEQAIANEDLGKNLLEICQEHVSNASKAIAGQSEKLGRSFSDSASAYQQGVQQLKDGLDISLTKFQDTFSESSLQMLSHLTKGQEKLINDLQETTAKQSEVSSDLVDTLIGRTEDTLSTATNKITVYLEQVSEKHAHELDGLSKSLATTIETLDNKVGNTISLTQECMNDLIANSRVHFDQQKNIDNQRFEGQLEQVRLLRESLHHDLSALQQQQDQQLNEVISNIKLLQSSAAENLLNLGEGLEKPMAELIQTASETPKAAADAIAQLKAETLQNAERENELIKERADLINHMNSLFNEMAEGTKVQRDAISALVESSSGSLTRLEEQFSEGVQRKLAGLEQITSHFEASSVEIATLGDAFAQAVTHFADSNSALMDSLQKIDASLDQTAARSDEQLSYYVAQARDLIDSSLISQNELLDKINLISKESAAAASILD